MDEVRLYSAQVCPFAQRTRLVLLEKSVDFDLTEIDLENKPDWFKEVSPYSKVPVVMHGDVRVYESAVINEYLDEVFPEPKLMPRQPAIRAQARIWIDFCNNRFIPTFYKLLLSQEEETRTGLREKLREDLLFMEKEGLAKLGSEGPYWLGNNLSLVDITFYPFFERFVVIEHYRGVEIPSECQRLKTWYAAMCERKSVKATANTRDYYIEKYTKYADGTASGITAQEMRDG